MKLYAVKFEGEYKGGLVVVRAGSKEAAVKLAEALPSRLGELETVELLWSEGAPGVISEFFHEG